MSTGRVWEMAVLGGGGGGLGRRVAVTRVMGTNLVECQSGSGMASGGVCQNEVVGLLWGWGVIGRFLGSGRESGAGGKVEDVLTELER